MDHVPGGEIQASVARIEAMVDARLSKLDLASKVRFLIVAGVIPQIDGMALIDVIEALTMVDGRIGLSDPECLSNVYETLPLRWKVAGKVSVVGGRASIGGLRAEPQDVLDFIEALVADACVPKCNDTP